eukprot:gi/632967600/ref/XP_007900066.1/ PREDICTED: protein phosphatase Slingshot homolog 1 isoform X2 [Callorhinchus milii]
MALVTVQRSPTPSASSSPSVSEVGSDDDRRLQQSLSDSFFTVKGAALFLQQGSGPQVPRCYHHHKYAGDLQLHLQVMINHLRSEDRIKLAVRLESTWANRIRYMVVVYTSGHQDTEENVLLGMDFSAKESNTCTIGMVLPLWSDTTIHLDGDGGFSVSTASRIHIFKPVSVQAMWSALQILHKSCEIARRYNYYPSGIALTWTSYYESCISSDQSCINEWNAMKDLQSTRPDSPALFVDKPTENELTERLIKTKLRCLMMSRDLENVTSKEIRNELEQQMTCNLKEYKGFIDNEMLTILGQMDKASLIFDHLYLGSEWNASNLEELQGAGVGYILNVTREIDNFFSGLFDYHNIRVFDEDTTDLLSFWNDTYNFITKAKKNHSKCLVHCKMGVSRSASTVIAYAMKEYGWSLERAYKYVKEKRSIAQPNTGFMKQLAEYEGILDASKQRHNSLWRRNSDGDLQETVRDGTFSSGRSLSNQDDESSGDPETPQTCGKQISEPPRRQGLAKDPTQAVNSNYYFRCLSDPSVDGSSYTEGPKESEPFSDCIDKGERDALRVDNVGFRYKGDGIPESRVIRSPQPWDTYEGEERMRSHQGISYQPFRAVEEPEENKNTLGLGVKHTEEDKALANGPSPGHASGTNESLANVQEASTNVENQLNKDNANNNNNAARICSKGDGDVNITGALHSVTPPCTFLMDGLESTNDSPVSLDQEQTGTEQAVVPESDSLGYLSDVTLDVPMTELFSGTPSEAEICQVTEEPVGSFDASCTTETDLSPLHETEEVMDSDVGLATHSEGQGEGQETTETLESCEILSNSTHSLSTETETLTGDMMSSQVDAAQELEQIQLLGPEVEICDCPTGFEASEQVQVSETQQAEQVEYDLHQSDKEVDPTGSKEENSAEVNEDTPFALSEPSNGQLVEDNHKVPRVCCNEGKNAKQMIYNQEMERSKVQSYLMQHQESILQLQKAGLVRKHTKELERLTYLRSSSKREASETKRGTYVKDEAIDLFAQDPVADIQDQAQSYEDVENNVVPEANFEDYPLPDGVYQKTSTPCISGRSGTGFLTKERLQQICATLITSPHATSLTRSSSSDSIHSIRGQPGLVELRTQEIEARMRQAGLTVCSEMKRSHSLAKLASLNLSSEDLSREKEAENLMLKSSHVKLAESLLLHNVVERMCWNTNLHREMEIQTGQLSPVKPLNQSIELSGSVAEHKLLNLPDIQYSDQTEHLCSTFSPTKCSAPDSDGTGQCMDFISVPSFGLNQFHTQSDNELYPLTARGHHGRTHPVRKLRKTCERKRTSNPFYNTM